MTPLLRDERPSDIVSISEITQQAFANHPHSRQTEQRIVKALRDAGALEVSLVAEFDEKVVGHIAFSRVSIADGTAGWYVLGPVSVSPAYQRRGLGSALVREGLRRLESLDAQGCVVVVDPGFYQRFGFSIAQHLTMPGIPPEFFLAQPFGPSQPHGEVTHHQAFSVEA